MGRRRIPGFLHRRRWAPHGGAGRRPALAPLARRRSIVPLTTARTNRQPAPAGQGATPPSLPSQIQFPPCGEYPRPCGPRQPPPGGRPRARGKGRAGETAPSRASHREPGGPGRRFLAPNAARNPVVQESHERLARARGRIPNARHREGRETRALAVRPRDFACRAICMTIFL